MLLAVGIVDVLARRENLDRLGPAPHQLIQQPGMQPLFHVQHRSRLPFASVAYRLSIISSVARSQALAGLRINRDTFPSPQSVIGTEVYGPSYREDALYRERGGPRYQDLIGEPLIMKPGSIHRLLNIESKIDDTHENVGDSGNDGRSARRAQHQEQLPIFQNNGGCHGRERPLFGPMALAGPWISP